MKVTFFPRNDYNAKVCNHRWGKKMTYCENSDTLESGLYEPVVLWAFRYNLTLGCFVSKDFDYLWDANSSISIKNTGIINYDYYYAKQGGGSTQEGFNQYADLCRAWFRNLYGRNPSCISYGGSDMSYSDLAAQKFIAGRSNNWNPFGDPYTWYGKSFPEGTFLGEPQAEFDRSREMLHLMSIRWCDEVKSGRYTVEGAMTALMNDVNATKANGGFYNAFAHWHQLLTGGYAPVTFQDYRNYMQLISDTDIHFCSFGEAMEYAIERVMIKKLSCYSPILEPDKVKVVVEFKNDFSPIINQDCLNTPLSIEVDLSSTPLKGKNIKLDAGNYIKVGTDRYIIDLMPPKYSLVSTAVISEDTVDNSLNTDIPVITTSVVDNIVNVTCDQKCNFVVFRRVTNDAESKVNIVDYKYDIDSFTISKTSGYQYAIGAVNKFKYSSATSWL